MVWTPAMPEEDTIRDEAYGDMRFYSSFDDDTLLCLASCRRSLRFIAANVLRDIVLSQLPLITFYNIACFSRLTDIKVSIACIIHK